MYNFLSPLLFFIQTYTVTSCTNRRNKCTFDPPLSSSIELPFTIPDYTFDPDFDSSVIPGNSNILELTLSSDLSMFFAHLLHFATFHVIGLLLCYFCTINFRGSTRR